MLKNKKFITLRNPVASENFSAAQKYKVFKNSHKAVVDVSKSYKDRTITDDTMGAICSSTWIQNQAHGRFK